MAENYIQVPPDSTGKKVRNLKVQTVVDGVLTDVYIQAVSISDSNGNSINEFVDYAFNVELLKYIKGIFFALNGINGSTIDPDTL